MHSFRLAILKIEIWGFFLIRDKSGFFSFFHYIFFKLVSRSLNSKAFLTSSEFRQQIRTVSCSAGVIYKYNSEQDSGKTSTPPPLQAKHISPGLPPPHGNTADLSRQRNGPPTIFRVRYKNKNLTISRRRRKWQGKAGKPSAALRSFLFWSQFCVSRKGRKVARLVFQPHETTKLPSVGSNERRKVTLSLHVTSQTKNVSPTPKIFVPVETEREGERINWIIKESSWRSTIR